jgi:hypothetical protein
MILSRRLLSKSLENRLLKALRLGSAGPSTLDLAITADEKLLKVPLDALETEKTGLLVLEPGPEGVGAVTVDLGLLHDGEAHAVVELTELLNVIVGAGLLAAELVAGEAEDHKVIGVLALEVGPELLKASILRGEAALGGSVDDEDDFALIVGKGNLLAALVKRLKVVKASSRGHVGCCVVSVVKSLFVER